MTEPQPMAVIDDDDSRVVIVTCDHGTCTATDQGPQWSQAQLLDFACAALSANARCACFDGERAWFPRTPPDHIILELRRYERDDSDPDIDTTRPRAIPPAAISLAANRVFETRQVDEHDLQTDLRLVRFWWLQRQLGALRDD